MIQFLIQNILFALCIGFAAAVYHGILDKSPVLNWWFRFGQRFEKKWFYDPVWGCVKCISGQLCLWSYTILVVLPSCANWQGRGWPFSLPAGNLPSCALFALFGLITTICASILFAMVLARIITKLENT